MNNTSAPAQPAMVQAKENQKNNNSQVIMNSTTGTPTKRSLTSFQHSSSTPTGLEPPQKAMKAMEIDSPTSMGSPTSSFAKPEVLATVVTLPREVLLVSSRQDLDEFIKKQTGGRKLTREEKAEVSRQRKLIKNRKSASASRKRKKEHLEVLEESHKQLLQENAELKQRIQKLESENTKMSGQVGIINKLSQVPLFSYAHDLFKSTKKVSLSLGMQQAIALLLIFQISLSVNFFYASQTPEFNTFSSSKHLGYFDYYNNNNNNLFTNTEQQSTKNSLTTTANNHTPTKNNDLFIDHYSKSDFTTTDQDLFEKFYSSSSFASSSTDDSFHSRSKLHSQDEMFSSSIPFCKKRTQDFDDCPGSSCCNATSPSSSSNEKFMKMSNDNSDDSSSPLSNSEENNANSSSDAIDSDLILDNNALIDFDSNEQLINSTGVELDIFSDFFNPSTTTSTDFLEEFFKNSTSEDPYDISYVIPQ